MIEVAEALENSTRRRNNRIPVGRNSEDTPTIDTFSQRIIFISEQVVCPSTGLGDRDSM